MIQSFVAFADSPWFPAVAMALALWSIPWKGYALWVAAKNTHKWWFIALLLVNTAAILEIIYIFGFGRPALKKTAGMSSSAV
jgi:hypothetical protein